MKFALILTFALTSLLAVSALPVDHQEVKKAGDAERPGVYQFALIECKDEECAARCRDEMPGWYTGGTCNHYQLCSCYRAPV